MPNYFTPIKVTSVKTYFQLARKKNNTQGTDLHHTVDDTGDGYTLYGLSI